MAIRNLRGLVQQGEYAAFGLASALLGVACGPAAPSAGSPPATLAAAPTAPPAKTSSSVVSCAAHASAGSAGGAPIKFGADASLSGATANFGLGTKRGIEICLKEFNAAGGYGGRKVEIPVLDDQAKPEAAVNNITRFVQQDKVVALLGPTNTGSNLAVVPKVDEAEIPMLVPLATAVGVVYADKDGKPASLFDEPGVKARKWVFRASMQDNFQVETILKYGKDHNWDAYGLIHDTSGLGQVSGDTAKKLISAAGLKLLDTETLNVGETDMTSQLQKMKDAGVKQIITFAPGPEDANLLRSAQKIGYQPQFSGHWGWADPVVVDLAGKALSEGVVTVASYTTDQTAAAADFHQKMLRDYAEDPFPIAAAQSYDATKLLLQALATSGPDPVKLRDALENIDGFAGVTNIPAKPFSKDRHHALEGNDMFAAMWREGELVRAK